MGCVLVSVSIGVEEAGVGEDVAGVGIASDEDAAGAGGPAADGAGSGNAAGSGGPRGTDGIPDARNLQPGARVCSGVGRRSAPGYRRPCLHLSQDQ